MKKLLVGSVFADHERTPTWYKLQIRMLDETLGAENYTHLAANNRCDLLMFGRSEVIATYPEPGEHPGAEHKRGLNDIWVEFLKRKDYDNYLILDSDAFPIQKNWLERLQLWMREDDNLPERKWASPVRFENLDTFAHPCVVFLKGSYIEELRLLGAHPFNIFRMKNLLGYRFDDLAVTLPIEVNDKPIWLPMTKTNGWSPHPVLSTIYGGLFYHHAAGSRPLEVRSLFLRQYDHHVPRWSHAQAEEWLWKEISLNPLIFINQLHGNIQ